MTKPKFGGSLQCVSRYGFSILDFSYCGKQRAILDFITMIYHNCWFLQAPFFGWINLPRLKWFYLGGHNPFSNTPTTGYNMLTARPNMPNITRWTCCPHPRRDSSCCWSPHLQRKTKHRKRGSLRIKTCGSKQKTYFTYSKHEDSTKTWPHLSTNNRVSPCVSPSDPQKNPITCWSLSHLYER